MSTLTLSAPTRSSSSSTPGAPEVSDPTDIAAQLVPFIERALA